MKVTLTTLIVALSAFSISLSASADPECVYRQIRELPMHWANPSDCARFYRCTNKNVKREVVCAAKKEYNPKTGKCASAGKGYCTLSLAAPFVGGDNACADEVSGAYVPNGKNCREFYICNDNVAYAQTCDAGSVFNVTQAGCVPDANVECWQNYCLDEPDGTYLADDASCLNFYICNDKQAVKQNCGTGSYYNSSANNCQPDANNEHCWENFCVGQADGTWVKNPQNCHGYYICKLGEATAQQCPDGSYFDWKEKTCQPGACPDDETTPGEPCEPTQAPTAPPCTGECTCPGGSREGEFLPDPTSCMHYYVCTGGVLVRSQCGTGFYFDEVSKLCQPDENNVCPQCNANYRRAKRSAEDNVEALKATEQLESIDLEQHLENLLKEELPAPAPVPSCGGRYMEGELIPHEIECRKYQMCHDGELSTHECGAGSYFDHEQRACLRDEFYICNPRPELELVPEPKPQSPPIVETAVVPYVEPAAAPAPAPTPAPAGCTCPGGYTSGQIAAHPTDCDKYYVCSDGKLVLHECGQGFKFESCIGACTPDTDHTCWPEDNGCGGTSSPPVNICLNKPNGLLVPNPYDCTAYYTCKNNEATSESCTFDSWFNPGVGACELDLNATCINPCKGTTGISMLPHPDCSKFYLCNNGQTHVDSCPENTGFNEQYGACTANAPCPSNVCHNQADGVTFPVPDDNTKYYVCLSGVAVEGSCNPNTQYNPAIGVCMQAPSPNCDQTPCQNGTNVQAYPTVNNSPNSFCYCRDKNAYENSCQPDYVFNAAIGICYSNAPCDPEVCLENPEYTVSVNRNDTENFCLCVAETQVIVDCPNNLSFNPRAMLCLPPVTQDPHCNPTFCLDQPDYTTAPATTTNTGFCVCRYGGSTYHACPEDTIYLPNMGFCFPNTAEAQCDVTQCAKGTTFFPTYNDPYAFCYCSDEKTVEIKECPTGSKFSAEQLVCLREFCDSSYCTSSTPANEPFPAIDYAYGFCLCNGNEAHLVTCENGTMFDQTHGACLAEVNLECDLALCQEPNQPYPYDTPAKNDDYSFCYCIDNTTVHLIHCPAGTIYDQKYGICANETIVNPPPCGGQSECTCPGGYAAGSLQPHPTNCNQYYICSNGQLQLQTCGAHLYYDPSVAACMPDAGVCTNTPTTCTCVGAFKENELIANGQNRNSYYRCLNAQLHEESCAPTYYFDSVQKACYSEYNSRQFYKPRSAITEDFFCQDSEKRSVPANCSQYEICIDSMWQRRSCSKQRYYNPERQQCLEPRDDTVCNGARVHGLPPCNGETEQQTLPHKDGAQCEYYYRCLQGKWHLKACREQEFYSRELRTCLRTDAPNPCEARNASETELQKSETAKCQHTAVRAYAAKCDMYLMCLEGEWWYQSCPLGMYFNARQNYCMPNTAGQCTSEERAVSIEQQQLTEFSDDNCTHDGALRPSALACDRYFICVHGKWRQQSCKKSGYYYNVTAEACLADTENVCAELAQLCENGERRKFPLNCKAFEVCENGSWQRRDCGQNSTYDVLLQQCVENEHGYCAANGLRRTCRRGEKRAWPIKSVCTQFFHCDADSWRPGSCLAGHTYVAELQTCVPHAANDSCQPMWHTQKNPTVVKPHNITVENVCAQQEDGASVPHAEDCTRFYLCLHGQSIGEQHCVAGSFFDAALGYCRPNDGSCTPPLTGVCEGAQDDDLIADPADCRNYYRCSFIDGTQLLHCAEGHYYEHSARQCRIDHGECQAQPPATHKCANVSEHGAKLPHERYCNIYYACVRGLAIPVECPDGFEFNPVLSHCQLDQEQQCPNGELINGNETTYSCGNLTDGTYLPNHSDCTRYYICANGHAQPKRCADEAFFDSQLLLCVPDDGSCPYVDKSDGDNRPQPPDPAICEGKHGQMLPDPVNCNEFYVCINGKLRHERCYQNFYFDVVSNQCQSFESAATTTTNTPSTTPTTPAATTSSEFSTTTASVDASVKPALLDLEPAKIAAATAPQRCTDKPTNFTALCAQIPEGGSIAEQGDCRRYISCQESEPVSQRCRNGESYDSLLGVCRQNDGTCLLENGLRAGECNGRHGALARDAENCRAYFVCINGQKIPGECAESEYFDRVSNRCQLDATNQCSLAPKKANDNVSCKGLSESVLYPYLKDRCRSYFQCVKGVPKIHECADGFYFNATTTQCVKEITECVMPNAAAAQSILHRAPETAAIENNKTQRCKNATSGRPYANIEDRCRSYYVCDGSDSIVYTTCPAGTLYSSEKRACAAAAHVVCKLET